MSPASLGLLISLFNNSRFGLVGFKYDVLFEKIAYHPPRFGTLSFTENDFFHFLGFGTDPFSRCPCFISLVPFGSHAWVSRSPFSGLALSILLPEKRLPFQRIPFPADAFVVLYTVLDVRRWGSLLVSDGLIPDVSLTRVASDTKPFSVPRAYDVLYSSVAMHLVPNPFACPGFYGTVYLCKTAWVSNPNTPYLHIAGGYGFFFIRSALAFYA